MLLLLLLGKRYRIGDLTRERISARNAICTFTERGEEGEPSSSACIQYVYTHALSLFLSCDVTFPRAIISLERSVRESRRRDGSLKAAKRGGL